ncbi:uncharacterized protein LOC130273216 [Hyla sarda]|uniref:uncharacterized protein LOC130273216 n=1 Tax=Hyla sarda TaxID=327740 RepID=UPI0024C3BB1E|nr:uncharacterized protein LOC130273216 [Hyla sarda]
MSPPTSHTPDHTNNGLKKFSLWEHMKKGCICNGTSLSDNQTKRDPASELKKDILRLEKEYSSSRERLQKQIIVYKTVADFAPHAALSDNQMDKDPADITKELKKNIHRLEKEYNSSRQRLQKEIIVYKTGKNRFSLTSSNLNIIQVNVRDERPEALTYQIPIIEIAQQLPKDNLMGGDNARHACGHPPFHYTTKTETSEIKKSSCKIPGPASYQFSSTRTSTERVTFDPIPANTKPLIKETTNV